MVFKQEETKQDANKVKYRQMDDSHCEAIEQLRKNLKDVLSPEHDSDELLLKWLRAKNFNIKKSELIFRQFLRIRELFQVDTLADTYVKPKVAKYEYTGFLGFAKDDSPVRYVALGKGDHLGFMTSMTTSETVRYCTSIIEKDKKVMKSRAKQVGKEINEVTYIFDMEELSLQAAFHKPVLETAWDMLRAVQDTYPEIWRIIIFVNVPSYFHIGFNFFKPIFRMALMSKIRVVKKEDTAAELLKYIDPEVLPVFLGGQRTDSSGDPMCREFLTFGGLIPEEYYLNNQPLLQESEPEVETVVLGARSVYNYSIENHIPKSILSFELRSENGSIELTMFHKEFGNNSNKAAFPGTNEFIMENDLDSKLKQISVPVRLQTHLAPMDEKFTVLPWAGIYVFRFDNSYSWFTSKRLIFRIKAIPPKN